MSAITVRLQAKSASNLMSSFTPVRSSRLLQRKCACGGKSDATGECEACRKRRHSLQPTGGTSELGTHNYFSVPPVVHEVLRSPGQPLDARTRAFMEPRFGYDFSKVRLHTDARAAESAQIVNARAYTVGQDVVFSGAENHPDSKDGMRLLAHELVHTIQQRGKHADVQRLTFNRSASENDHLEAEADNAAEQVVSGRLAHALGAARTSALQRQDKNKPPPPPKVVAPVEPNSTQKKMIDAARRAAAIRTQTAMFKASGVQGAAPFHEARRLAQIKFDWSDPNMDQIGEVLSGMGGGLPTVDIKVAGAGDPECGSRSGYVRGHRPPIVLCHGFFKDPADAEGRIRTMIHEMAHVKGIGKADVAEQYLITFDCTSKGAFESADSWANYVHCLSGQTPDKPEEIVVPKGGTKSAPPKKPTGSK